MSVLYLDLNNFKQVNDSLGHAAGDELLQEVANRLKQCLRDLDTVARMGGDEFVVLLENIRLPEHASNIAKKIRNAISQPIKIEGRSLCILPSIGIALYPDHGDEAQQLLRHADEAMYFEKKNSDSGFAKRAYNGVGTKSSIKEEFIREGSGSDLQSR